jgi:hypothetical protein
LRTCSVGIDIGHFLTVCADWAYPMYRRPAL